VLSRVQHSQGEVSANVGRQTHRNRFDVAIRDELFGIDVSPLDAEAAGGPLHKFAIQVADGDDLRLVHVLQCGEMSALGYLSAPDHSDPYWFVLLRHETYGSFSTVLPTWSGGRIAGSFYPLPGGVSID
jgi:hypothetical protein